MREILEQVTVGPSRAVAVSRLEEEIARARGELHRGRGPVPSTSFTTLNLVVCASTPADAAGLREDLAHLSLSFPAFCVTAVLDPAVRGEIEACLAMACHPGHRAQVCCEQLALHVPAPALRRLPSLVVACLQPDLPVFLWWRGEPPFGSDLLERLVETSHRVVWDSRDFSLSGLGETARLAADPYHQEQAFSDLAWTALTGWREQIARRYDPPGRRSCLGTLEEVEIAFTAPEQGLCSPPLLLAGWLAGRLGWRLRPLELRDGAWQAELSGAPRLVLRREGAGRPALTSVRMAGGEGCSFPVQEVPRPRDVELMGVEMEMMSRDPVYEEALAACLELAVRKEAEA